MAWFHTAKPGDKVIFIGPLFKTSRRAGFRIGETYTIDRIMPIPEDFPFPKSRGRLILRTSEVVYPMRLMGGYKFDWAPYVIRFKPVETTKLPESITVFLKKPNTKILEEETV